MRQRWTRWLLSSAVVVTLGSVWPAHTFAQDTEQPSFAVDVIKHVAFDPTTYAPAALGYISTVRDWNSSQPFFNAGWVERNPRFTISGFPNDRPIAYDEGRGLILRDALTNLQFSIVNNVTNRILERLLIEQHPEHRRLWKTLGWIERIGYGSYLSYQLSADHFQQALVNEQRARDLGYR
jgi:hypothetical protein